jgi:hypothetical protein
MGCEGFLVEAHFFWVPAPADLADAIEKPFCGLGASSSKKLTVQSGFQGSDALTGQQGLFEQLDVDPRQAHHRTVDEGSRPRRRE